MPELEPMISVEKFCELKLLPVKKSTLHKIIESYPASQVRRYWIGRKKVVIASELYEDLKRVGFIGGKRD